MSRITLKSQAIVIAQLEAQIAELTTHKGILMNEVAALSQELSPNDIDLLHEKIALQFDEINALNADNARLAQSNTAAYNRCDVLEELLVQAVDSRPVVKSAPRMTVAPTVIESQPTVEITNEDRAFYSKFKALPQAQRLSIIEFARPVFGHIGLTNIIQVRAAWHQAQAA